MLGDGSEVRKNKPNPQPTETFVTFDDSVEGAEKGSVKWGVCKYV